MLFDILYLIGLTAVGITGAIAAGREKMDIFGVIVIADITAFVMCYLGITRWPGWKTLIISC